MSGVRQQRHRIGEEAIERLDDDEAQIERDADREGAVETGGCMRMPVPAMSMASMIMLMIVIHGWASHRREIRAWCMLTHRAECCLGLRILLEITDEGARSSDHRPLSYARDSPHGWPEATVTCPGRSTLELWQLMVRQLRPAAGPA